MTNISIINTSDNITKIPEKWVIDAIKKASGSKWTHTQVLIGNTMYESTFPGGFKKTENYTFVQRENNIQLSLPRDLTEEELIVLKGWWEEKIADHIQYGVFKLLIYVSLYKTRNLWKKLNFYPFSYDKVWGDFCSAAGINCFKYAAKACNAPDLDYLPNTNGEVATPGDHYNALIQYTV